MNHTALIRYKLTQLTASLKDAQLYSELSPSAYALSSEQPFAVDRLTCEQWLQFIFIPQIMRLLEQPELLPETMAISPYAQEVFKHYPNDTRAIVKILKELDELFH